MKNKSTFELAVSNEVLVKMVSAAASEVEGVASLATGISDIKGVFAKNAENRAVRIDTSDGTISLDVLIKIKENYKARAVSEEVQKNVKERIQSMTGSAVDRVNVSVADVEFNLEEQLEEV